MLCVPLLRQTHQMPWRMQHALFMAQTTRAERVLPSVIFGFIPYHSVRSALSSFSSHALNAIPA